MNLFTLKEDKPNILNKTQFPNIINEQINDDSLNTKSIFKGNLSSLTF